MIKKGITGAVVVALLLGFLYGRDAISLVERFVPLPVI